MFGEHMIWCHRNIVEQPPTPSKKEAAYMKAKEEEHIAKHLLHVYQIFQNSLIFEFQ